MQPIRLENLVMRYDPFPVGIVAPTFEPSLYAEMLRGFPPLELFEFLPRFGKKYSLSEVRNPKAYSAVVASSPLWREVHRYFKSPEFIYSVIDALREKGVDLGIRRADQKLSRRLRKLALSVRNGGLPIADPPITSRFEFSTLPANGGIVIPHTDAVKKFITIVFSIVGEGEWDETWGGGTDILKTQDPARSYNFVNKQVPYEETETLETVHFRPNQAMLFVKTFNSLHGVKEMRGPEGTLRRTLTVNFERG
jgi:hypothetical protein